MIDSITEEKHIELLPVTLVQRFMNFSIDYIIRILLLALLQEGLLLIGLKRIIVWLNSGNLMTQTLKEIPIDFTLTFLYYFLFEYFWQRTPAKFITKTYIVKTNGELPTSKDVLIRSLARLVPFEAFSFFGKTPIGWHDKWSKTRVISYRN